MIGASNHFEVAIATATMLYGLSSGAALATVVGVLIEVPLMLGLVKFCVRTKGGFPAESNGDADGDHPYESSHPKATDEFNETQAMLWNDLPQACLIVRQPRQSVFVTH